VVRKNRLEVEIMRPVTASFLTLALLVATVPAAAKQTGDWDAVKLLINQEIALKVKNGPTSFGVLRSVDDISLIVRLAEKKGVSDQESHFSRDEIERVWHAELRFGERQVLKGALIGAGVGAAIGTAAVASDSGGGEGDGAFAAAAVVGYTILTAGAGAVIGAFKKKGHKRVKLIYSV
jgi:small nuclear ribonucleoprotein (snRNP)-like protein